MANLVKGKTLDEALTTLRFLPKKAGLPVSKLIKSAADNAVTNNHASREELFVKEITVNKGLVMGRFRAGARGRAYPITRRMSHVAVTLAARASEASSKASKTKKKS